MENKDLAEIASSPENSRNRAEMWSDFVGWDGRRRGESGFLMNQLNQHRVRTVLDVALGDGVDTIYLLKQDFEVDCNEVDSAFRQKAKENAQREDLVIAPTALDWRRLEEEYPEDSHDAVICLGNSLTCLFGRENQLAALQQFREVLKPGGILLIDERNYQRILDNREAVLKGQLHLTSKYLYTGTAKVQTRFVEISEEAVVVEYAHKEIERKAYYRIYPFKKGELLGLIQEAGFSKVTKFRDYESGDNPEADFYQYVCVK